MLKIYGSMLCKDCIDCRKDLDGAGVAYEFLDFSEDLRNLKEFLRIRDTDAQFQSVKEVGSIGIPCIVEESGSILLNWSKYVSQDKA